MLLKYRKCSSMVNTIVAKEPRMFLFIIMPAIGALKTI